VNSSPFQLSLPSNTLWGDGTKSSRAFISMCRYRRGSRRHHFGRHSRPWYVSLGVMRNSEEMALSSTGIVCSPRSLWPRSSRDAKIARKSASMSRILDSLVTSPYQVRFSSSEVPRKRLLIMRRRKPSQEKSRLIVTTKSRTCRKGASGRAGDGVTFSFLLTSSWA
jgi:hypothetical protein